MVVVKPNLGLVHRGLKPESYHLGYSFNNAFLMDEILNGKHTKIELQTTYRTLSL